MTPFLLLAAVLATSVHAETEDESIARIRTAWKSKDPDKVLALYAVPEKRTFEWNGPKMSRFGIRMKYDGSNAPGPEIVAVVESCGYTSWERIGGNFGGFSAHKIRQLIVPPTVSANAIAFEITKDDGKPFFKKTINTSKGAIILIEPETS